VAAARSTSKRMSVTFVLVPIAIAVAGAIRAKMDKDRSVRVETRMRDEELLRRALEEYGCRNVRAAETVTAATGGREILFERAESGTFEGLFAGIDESEAETFVRAVEHEYTRLLQAQVYERVLAGAAERGYTLESERVEADNSVVLTLRVPEG
jgi:hypothetical protein